MYDINHTLEQEHCLSESLVALQNINKRLAKLTKLKEELTFQIINALQHQHEGQKTYEHDVWKIEVKTPCVYSLDKKRYESGEFTLPAEYNPIKESKSYSIDKRLCEKYLTEAPDHVAEALIALIDKKPGKPSVSLKERV